MEGLGRPKRAPGLNWMIHNGGQLFGLLGSDQGGAARSFVGNQAVHAATVEDIDPFTQGPIGDKAAPAHLLAGDADNHADRTLPDGYLLEASGCTTISTVLASPWT
jgi:hypothetical protein